MKNLLIRLLDRLLTRMAGTDAELYALNRLLVKAGRRCAYDMKHMVSIMSSMSQTLKLYGHEEWRMHEHERYQARAENWLQIFNPADDGGDYRDRLHHQISDLQTQIGKYKELLAKHNIEDSVDTAF